MSYILDALNKAERERRRRRQPVPSPAAPAEHDAPPRNPWVWVAVLAVALNAVLALLLVWSSWRDERTSASTAPPAPVEAEPVAQPAAVASLPVPAPAPASAPANAASLPDIHPTPRAPVAPTLPLMTDAELQQQAAAQQAEEAAALAAAAEPEPEPPPSRPVPLESIPLRSELPPDVQQALPSLRLDVHVYDEARANRFVMINLRRYREGDDIAPDLHLERITREGMVVVFRGRQFRWLNN